MQTERKLGLITEKAKLNPSLKFSALMHLINVEFLSECFKKLRKNAACGIDDVTVKAYEENLTGNLANLEKRLKTKAYKPQPVLRVCIPKPGKDELRPLGIPTVEDKLVQMAVKTILEALYEPLFLNSSNGFRTGKGCLTAIKQLNKAVMCKPTNYIVEVDIEKFFDTVDHDWMLKFLQERIKDPNLLWLIRKFLKAGVMDAGELEDSEEGTPQGGVISPILANIYLHYVLDLWFEKFIKREATGHIELIRYCDDFVVTCESAKDAYGFHKALVKRLLKFNLKISQEKTKVIKFGRQAWKVAKRSGCKVETFDFLGFTHYCAATRNEDFSIKHKTIGQRLIRKLKAMNEWLRDIRSVSPLEDWWKGLKAKLNGHYGFFGINGNMRSLNKYYYCVRRLVFKWINRRSQKRSMNWEQFQTYLDWNPLPTPRIKHNIWEA